MPDAMKIIYTYTDEAPALATHSLLPVLQAYAARRASTSRRATSRWPGASSRRSPGRRRPGELGALAKTPEANIIKLPTSAPRCRSSRRRRELQAAGTPSRLPRGPADRRGEGARAAYDTVKGSAVNPVLREGNSDRRARRR
jgi:isocitrate dehydrogenase